MKIKRRGGWISLIVVDAYIEHMISSKINSSCDCSIPKPLIENKTITVIIFSYRIKYKKCLNLRASSFRWYEVYLREQCSVQNYFRSYLMTFPVFLVQLYFALHTTKWRSSNLPSVNLSKKLPDLWTDQNKIAYLSSVFKSIFNKTWLVTRLYIYSKLVLGKVWYEHYVSIYSHQAWHNHKLSRLTAKWSDYLLDNYITYITIRLSRLKDITKLNNNLLVPSINYTPPKFQNIYLSPLNQCFIINKLKTHVLSMALNATWD